MTNNKQQTEINAVEYLDKVNQFAKGNNTDKPKQQTAIEWLYNELLFAELNILEWNKSLEQAKAMQKQQAEHYATFITNCVINNLPTITFNDWINLHNNEQQ
jgi:hypothetical protein